MNRGELWWFELPDVGRRPGLILTRQAAIPVLTWLLIIPATRTIRAIPTELELGPADGAIGSRSRAGTGQEEGD